MKAKPKERSNTDLVQYLKTDNIGGFIFWIRGMYLRCESIRKIHNRMYPNLNNLSFKPFWLINNAYNKNKDKAVMPT
jgi:hypothetical protein